MGYILNQLSYITLVNIYVKCIKENTICP